ncbi:hypothetical protein HPC49_29690 [Pyxidicoccus fallax]|uniref:Uncharacterized protein n=1 Tax=Pyxidicoccus fallax TaxID=394095 RepID=A0A848LUZ2_9BACT|nr:hypothetical protein [Pyxidicoccus fallax]NMO21293.1 hypothetical protein [Pyxidicoccus fallax]NPC82381.1 hypothetical protein [Pyxidicoccus fallax]
MKAGHVSSWRRMNLPAATGGKRTVAAALEALSARPGFEVSGAAYGDLVEVRGTADAETLAVVTAEVEALVVSAGNKGAHAELAVFPLQGDVGACRVWSSRRRKLVDFPPDAREVQADYRFIQRQLREATAPPPPDPRQERRKRLLEEARGWPERYPVSQTRDFRSWQTNILEFADASARPVLERLGREHADTLVALSREADGSDLKWSAAARALGLSPGDLYPCTTALAVPVILTSKSWRKQLGLSAMELTPVMKALSRIAPDRVPEQQRRQLLRQSLEDARQEAECSLSALARWCEVSKQLGKRPRVECLGEALRLGTRPDADTKYPGFATFARQLMDWCVVPSAVPELRPWSEAEVRGALEELVEAGLPAALRKRIQVAREAVPPYGLKPRPAWELKPKRATKPTLRCEACGATLRPKVELPIPPLTEAHGARTVRIYECDACAEEEPTEEHVRLTVEPRAPRNAPRPEGFTDYPDVYEAKQLRPAEFVLPRYREFLEQQGLGKRRHVQLGGYTHGVYGEEVLIGVRCRHAETLLEFSPLALKLKLGQVRAAVGVCLQAGCKKPGISDELAVY